MSTIDHNAVSDNKMQFTTLQVQTLFFRIEREFSKLYLMIIFFVLCPLQFQECRNFTNHIPHAGNFGHYIPTNKGR